MFIAIRLNAMASSVGATCLKRGLSPREIYSAPTELREYLVRRGYKHFRPYGTELRKNLTQKQKVGPLLHREHRDCAEKVKLRHRTPVVVGHFQCKCPTNFSLSSKFDKLKLVGHPN